MNDPKENEIQRDQGFTPANIFVEVVTIKKRSRPYEVVILLDGVVFMGRPYLTKPAATIAHEALKHSFLGSVQQTA